MSTTTPIYRIKNWDRDYEFDKTRNRPFEPMKWIKVTTKQGSGYRNLVRHKKGPAHYGAWMGLVQIACKCIPRGVLVNSRGRGLSTAKLAEQSLLPAELFEELIPRLLDEEDVGWLEEITTEEVAQMIEVARLRVRASESASAPSAGKKDRAPAPPNQTLPKQTLPKKKDVGKSASAKASQTGGEKTRQPRNPVDDAYLDELQQDEAYRHLNVRICFRQMVRWCERKNKIPSRTRLVNWLNREEKPMEVSPDGSPPPKGPSTGVDSRTERLRKRNYAEIAKRSSLYERDSGGEEGETR